MVDKMYVCECYTCAMNLMLDEDERDTLYLSMWKRGRTKNYHPWSYRLRHIWRIITKGEPYEDDLCLDKKTAKEFLKDLNKLVKRMK